MCSIVEFWNEAANEWEDLASVAELKRHFVVLPDDTEPDMDFGDDTCLCYTDTEAIVKRSGLPFQESICPGDFIVGPPELVQTSRSGSSVSQRLVTRSSDLWSESNHPAARDQGGDPK